MQTNKPKRDLADFFKPYARHLPQSSVPRKRASPFAGPEEQQTETKDTKIARTVPKTPARTVSFKDVTPSPKSTVKRPIFSPSSDAALPIRSPRTLKSATNNKIDSKQKTLFETSSPPKSLRATETVVNPTTSFTLSDISERSQSVIQDGKVVAVRDSDDDDSDDLPSLEHILGLGNRKSHRDAADASELSFGSSQDEDVDREAERISLLSKFTQGRSVPIVGKEKIREFNMKRKQLKFDLSMILDDHFEDLGAVERTKLARMESDSESEDDTALTETDKRLLAEVVLNGGEDVDADDVNRVLSAMERTEALVGDRKFSFFDWKGMMDRRGTVKPTPFPSDAIPAGLWTEHDREGKRSRAFLSGITIELAADGLLSDQALRWTFWETLREQQPDLQQAYLRTIQAGSSHWTRLHVSAADVQNAFRLLGAAKDILQDNGSIVSKPQITQGEAGQDSAQLLVTLNLFQTICQDLDMSALSKLSSIVTRLCLDDFVTTDGRLVKVVETLLHTLLNLANVDARTHIRNRVLEDSMQHVHDPMLQAKLLSRIPGITRPATELRKTLADVFLLGQATLDRSSMTSNASLDALNEMINTHPMFTIIRKPNSTPSDYAILTALTAVLDVAIGPGCPPIHTSNTAVDGVATAATKVNHQDKAIETSIKSYNVSVDALADSIHSIFVTIKDTGASHMRRTEAKDALQALHYRCLYGIRLGVRKKKHVFDIIKKNGIMSKSDDPAQTERIVGFDGTEYRDRERARELMGRFLSKVKPQVHGRDDQKSNAIESITADSSDVGINAPFTV